MVNGFTGIDDYVSAICSSGQYNDMEFARQNPNALLASAFAETLSWAGVPGGFSYAGSAGSAVVLNSLQTGVSAQFEGNVSPAVRTLLNISVTSPTGFTGQMLLCDFLLYYPSLVVTGTPTTITNSVSLTRYTNGKGVLFLVAVQTTNGAASPALTFTYTADDNSSQTSNALTAAANSQAVSICYVNKIGSAGQVPFCNLVSGRLGCKSLTSYTIASGTTGTAVALLVKPLMWVPYNAIDLSSERDCLYQLRSLPQIQDGACLGFLSFPLTATAVNNSFVGRYSYAWK